MSYLPIRDVPSEDVGNVVQLFVDNNTPRVEAIQQSDGRFLIVPGGTVADVHKVKESQSTADEPAPKKKPRRKK